MRNNIYLYYIYMQVYKNKMYEYFNLSKSRCECVLPYEKFKKKLKKEKLKKHDKIKLKQLIQYVIQIKNKNVKRHVL